MALYGLLHGNVENESFARHIRPISSIGIVLPLKGGYEKLEEIISIHAPKGAKLVSVGEIKTIDIVLDGSLNLIGYNTNLEPARFHPYNHNLEPELTIIPVDYYGYN